MKIRKGEYLYIKLSNKFIIEGIQDYEFKDYINYFIYNYDYGIKLHIIGVKKDFDIISYLKRNIKDIMETYYEEYMKED